MTEPAVSGFSISKRLQSISHAITGIIFMCRSQHNAWVHLLAMALVCTAGWYLHVSRADWLWLILCIAMVFFAELINTAFEHLCDTVSPQYNLSVKHAKDIAAGSVLVCAVTAAVIGTLVFWPYLFS